jgi:natural product precursor
MKEINKLNLTQLNKVEIEKRQMNALRGGEYNQCVCGCGRPSSTSDNMNANAVYGYTISCAHIQGSHIDKLLFSL